MSYRQKGTWNSLNLCVPVTPSENCQGSFQVLLPRCSHLVDWGGTEAPRWSGDSGPGFSVTGKLPALLATEMVPGPGKQSCEWSMMLLVRKNKSANDD